MVALLAIAHSSNVALSITLIVVGAVMFIASVLPVGEPRGTARQRCAKFAKTMRIGVDYRSTALSTVYVVVPADWPVGGYEVHQIDSGRVVARTHSLFSQSEAVACADRLNRLAHPECSAMSYLESLDLGPAQASHFAARPRSVLARLWRRNDFSTAEA